MAFDVADIVVVVDFSISIKSRYEGIESNRIGTKELLRNDCFLVF